MDTLIPGLINDMGQECLIWVPFNELPKITSVSKKWSSEIHLPEFIRKRKESGKAQQLLVLGQAQYEGPNNNPNPDVKQLPSKPTYQLVVSDPKMGTWIHLPPIPGLSNGLPMFCGLVGSGSDLIVIGGLDPVTWEVSQKVYIYSFLSGKWRRGKDMPRVRISFFGCDGSDLNRTVLVAGGHDEEKNALKSASLYDVDKDEWVPLPNMNTARDECKVICHGGKFHVISGYGTDMQGCFERSMEVFDFSTWRWGLMVEEFLEAGSSPGSYVAGPNGRIYTCIGRRSGNVAMRGGDKWQVVAKVPDDVLSSHWLTILGDKLVVIGCLKLGESYSGYMLDLKSYKWDKIDMPEKFRGHVQCGCVLEI